VARRILHEIVRKLECEQSRLGFQMASPVVQATDGAYN
jgi:hypothetical protein